MNGALVALGIVVAFLLFKKGAFSGIFGEGTLPANQVSANGRGPAPNGGVPLEAAIGGAVGAGACIAGGAALGAPQAGAALAGVCGAIGSKLAPYAVEGAKKVGEGAKFVGVKIGQGAEFVGTKVGAGAAALGRGVASVASSAYSEAGAVVRQPGKLIELSTAPVAIADRGITQAYGSLPTPLKVAAAPVYGATKVATTVISKATDIGSGAVNAVTKGAGAVLSSINPFSSGVNCSVAQQPGNARDCRQRYGMTSAPGSDAWARAHGQEILLSGAGST